MFHRIAVATMAVLLLAGCSATIEQPAPKSAPVVERAHAVGRAIHTHSAALSAVRVPVPPTRVQVPSVGIDVPVQPVGVEPDGLMELPPNVAVAGWYKYGSDSESSTGTVVISAHVDSLEYGLGPFSQLKNLGVGTVITVTSADGSTVDYVVESVRSILKPELPLAEIFDREGARRLALITCGGQFDYDALNYSDNVVVIATPTVP